MEKSLKHKTVQQGRYTLKHSVDPYAQNIHSRKHTNINKHKHLEYLGLSMDVCHLKESCIKGKWFPAITS